MRFINHLAALLSATSLVQAIPATNSQEQSRSDLRLIKTSEADPGTWVTEEDKISKYRAKNINFVDITDIKDAETLARLNKFDSDTARVAAVVYPTTVSHQTEANGLISKATTAGPQSWLKTLSELVTLFALSYDVRPSKWA